MTPAGESDAGAAVAHRRPAVCAMRAGGITVVAAHQLAAYARNRDDQRILRAVGVTHAKAAS